MKAAIWMLTAVAGLGLVREDGQGVDPDEVRTVWEYLAGRYDANEDGKITNKEYGRGEEYFARLDRDGDGVIDRGDVEQGARRHARGKRERLEAPREGEAAPDFELELLGREKQEGEQRGGQRARKVERVKLSKLEGKRPVALIFGSYT